MAEYKLTTIKDIFDKVPTDRVKVCMAELTELILNCKERKEVMEGVTKVLGGKVTTLFPESVNWMDDEKGEITVNQTITIQK